MIRLFTLEKERGDFGNLFKVPYELHQGNYDTAHIGFTCRGPSMGVPSNSLLVEAATSSIKIEKGSHIFARGTRKSALWTITLNYTPKQWGYLLEYGNKYELGFDIMFRNSTTCVSSNLISMFRTQLTQDMSRELTICHESMRGYNKINFKRGGIKVIKKEDNVIVKVALLENGFFEMVNKEICVSGPNIMKG